jgi:hypothetical protein
MLQHVVKRGHVLMERHDEAFELETDELQQALARRHERFPDQSPGHPS